MTLGKPTGELIPPKPEGLKRTGRAIRVLLIEDNPGDARLIQEMIKNTGDSNLRFEHASSLHEGLEYLVDPEKPLDAVLLDLGLPDSQGFDTFTRFQKEGEAFTIIILSGLNDVDLALHAVRSGAQDYLVKGQINGDLLLRSIRHAIEREEAEKQLVESRERYQSLVDMMPDAIIVHSEDKIVFANPAAIKLLRPKNPEDLLGMNPLNLVHPDFLNVVTERMRNRDSEGKSQPALEERYIRLDGKVIDVEVTGTPFMFEEKQATQLIIRDITDRKEREREMEAVAAVSQNLRAANSKAEMLPVILDEAVASVAADEGTITLVIPETGDHLIAVGTGPRKLPVGKTIPQGKGLTSVVVETGQAHINNQFRFNPDPRTVKLSDIERTEALAIIPITAEAQVIGTLGLGRNLPFEESDIRVLTAICNIGGNAIHRADLFEQTQRRLRHLRSLREIDVAIASSLELKITLDVILAQATSELQVDAASILLLNDQQMLEYAAGRGFQTDTIMASRLKFGEGLAGKAALERTLVHYRHGEGVEGKRARPDLYSDEGFTSYYGAPLIAKGKVIGVLETFHRGKEVRDSEWTDFLQTLAGQAAIAIDNASLFQDLQRSNEDLRLAYDRTIEGWAHALSLRDMETIEHSRRVTEMTVRLATALGMSETQITQVRRGALLHDIGKMGIPDRVLGKTGPLNDEEWVMMRKHPEYAGQMLSAIDFLHPALPIPMAHHEKWDGSGYPLGLKGKEIPLEARIFAIIDVWDALTSDRPYRAAWPDEKVRVHIKGESGKHFDPSVVEAFFHYILDKNSK
jgi:PAS domain S-box-containing protein/putative nucleotidyltransferase with HDIG domain